MGNLITMETNIIIIIDYWYKMEYNYLEYIGIRGIKIWIMLIPKNHIKLGGSML